MADRDRVLRTAVCLLLLRRQFADQADLWKRAGEKARDYLAAALGLPADESTRWLDGLERMVNGLAI